MNDDDRGPNHSKPQIEVLDVSVVDLFIVGLWQMFHSPDYNITQKYLQFFRIKINRYSGNK